MKIKQNYIKGAAQKFCFLKKTISQFFFLFESQNSFLLYFPEYLKMTF